MSQEDVDSALERARRAAEALEARLELKTFTDPISAICMELATGKAQVAAR